MKIFQQNLFEESKGAFNPQHFERMLENTEIEECISEAILEACRTVQDSNIFCHLSLKTQSVSISEVAMNLIQEKLAERHIDVDFHFDKEGNVRSYFIIGGYIFILHKDELLDNNTKQGRRVMNQQLDKHIITIIYKLNELRSDVIKIALQYWQGNSFVYQKTLATGENNISIMKVITEIEPVAPERIKLKFKKDNLNVSGK